MTGPAEAGERSFPADVLDLFDREEEIEIVTVRADGRPRTTVLWIVVEDDVAYVRSVRGSEGRWYQDASGRPEVAIVAAGRRIPAGVVPATDEASVAACSAGLRRKYHADASLRAMLTPDVLPTTLRVEPA